MLVRKVKTIIMRQAVQRNGNARNLLILIFNRIFQLSLCLSNRTNITKKKVCEKFFIAVLIKSMFFKLRKFNFVDRFKVIFKLKYTKKCDFESDRRIKG